MIVLPDHASEVCDLILRHPKALIRVPGGRALYVQEASISGALPLAVQFRGFTAPPGMGGSCVDFTGHIVAVEVISDHELRLFDRSQWEKRTMQESPFWLVLERQPSMTSVASWSQPIGVFDTEVNAVKLAETKAGENPTKQYLVVRSIARSTAKSVETVRYA